MATITGLLAVNPAFLLEIKEDNRELRSLIACTQQSLASHNCAYQAKDCFMQLSRLRDQLAMHFALEEAFGYMDDALYTAPRLSEIAHTLKQEHVTMFVELCQLVDVAEEFVFIPPDEEAFVRAVVTRFEEFHRSLHRHELAEQQLILAACDDDIGVGD